MTAPAPPAMSEEIVGKIVDEVFGGAIEDAQVIRDIIAAYDRLRAAPPGVVVPVPQSYMVYGYSPREISLLFKTNEDMETAINSIIAALTQKDPAP